MRLHHLPSKSKSPARPGNLGLWWSHGNSVGTNNNCVAAVDAIEGTGRATLGADGCYAQRIGCYQC